MEDVAPNTTADSSPNAGMPQVGAAYLAAERATSASQRQASPRLPVKVNQPFTLFGCRIHDGMMLELRGV